MTILLITEVLLLAVIPVASQVVTLVAILVAAPRAVQLAVMAVAQVLLQRE
jgi:hypothetical protein